MKKVKNNLAQEILQKTLKEIRLRNNLKQTDLAEKLKLPQSFVSKYECGDRKLDMVELNSVCKALGLSLTSFSQEYENNLKRYEGK